MTVSQATIYGKARADEDASIRLGGITLYSPTERLLHAAIERASEVIGRHSAAHLTLTRVNLRSKARDELAEAHDDRLFGALVGLQLRLGRMDVLTCAASSGKTFQVLVHESRVSHLEGFIDAARDRLEEHGLVTVKDFEKHIFGSRQWGTWSSTSHILAHLVFRGTAAYLDTMTFASVRELDHALC